MNKCVYMALVREVFAQSITSQARVADKNAADDAFAWLSGATGAARAPRGFPQ